MLSELNNESFRLKRLQQLLDASIMTCNIHVYMRVVYRYIVHACTYVLTIHVFHSVKKSNADKQVLVTTYLINSSFTQFLLERR